VIEMRVREHQPMNARGRNRQRVPVAQAKLFLALEEPAIDQQPFAARFQQVLRPGNRAGGA
jgi:hypothetical protein